MPRNRQTYWEFACPECGFGHVEIGELAGTAPAKFKLLAVNGMPHSGKPDELVDAFGISSTSHVKV